ncbi:MAG: hypothetical protein GY711_26595 [bacterium]|nr:hypothetical protein [bacterium]
MRWILVLLAIVLVLLPAGYSDDDPQPGLKELKGELRASYPDKRRRAVKKLAELKEDKAWELVIGALADRAPEVADEAQVRIAAIGDAALRKKLWGKDGLASRDDWVRLRVAEAFGRMGGSVDAAVLARAIDPKDEAVARAACWSLERLAKRGALTGDRGKAVRRVAACLAGNRPARLRAAAYSAIDAIDPAAGEAHAHGAIGDKAAEVRGAALAVLHGRQGGRALPVARKLASDPDPRVRLAAIDVLRAIGTKAALVALVERLEVEERARPKAQLVAALRARTGMLHRADPRPWRRFLAQLAPNWSPRVDEASTKTAAVAARGARSAVALAGLPLVSDRVCVLVDFSGSLWNERVNGRTRKELLDGQIRGLLEHLPEHVEFNLVPYTNAPLPWRERLTRATSRARREAMRTFEGCQATGKGNFFDAALFALEDPRVDTVLVVTDGAPTGGRRWNLELMVDLLLEETRYSKVAFDVVLVDAPKRLQKSWRRLTDGSAGRMLAVGFEDLDAEPQREAHSPAPPDYTPRRWMTPRTQRPPAQDLLLGPPPEFGSIGRPATRIAPPPGTSGVRTPSSSAGSPPASSRRPGPVPVRSSPGAGAATTPAPWPAPDGVSWDSTTSPSSSRCSPGSSLVSRPGWFWETPSPTPIPSPSSSSGTTRSSARSIPRIMCATARSCVRVWWRTGASFP